MNSDNLPNYQKYTTEQLTAMGMIYYSGKANSFQKAKYEMVRTVLLEELRSIHPTAKDSGTAAYIHAAIERVLYEKNKEERRILEGMRANAHTAREQLKNWK